MIVLLVQPMVVVMHTTEQMQPIFVERSHARSLVPIANVLSLTALKHEVASMYALYTQSCLRSRAGGFSFLT